VAPELLIIAGLDPSGGAGLLADVRVAEQHGVRGLGVATALTVQNSQLVAAANPVDPDIVVEQLAAILGDVEIAAVKLGMLGSMAVARAVAAALDQTAAPLVWDPVLAATIGGVALLDGPAGDALAELARHVALLTPNAVEAHALTGIEVVDEASAVAAGRALLARGVPAALIKGGHVAGAADEVVDWLVTAVEVVALRGPRRAGPAVHGTGCALSTAIASHLAHGVALAEACRRARAWLDGRLAAPVTSGRGRPSVM
jgi:hydroxymethylpyrimidine/phosphomethylpyrimidine kinase